MRFVWDPIKAERNRKKHGVSFEAAKGIFHDPGQVVLENDFVDGEQRYLIIGMSAAFPTLLVAIFVAVDETSDEIIRVISARKAVAYEKNIYEDQNG
jgi:uncharacterized DUF497 family protein